MESDKTARHWGRGGAVGLALLAAACSQIPDALNPVEWYRSATDFVTGTDRPQSKPESATTADRNRPVPGADRPVPNLASVPERPQAPSARERARLEEGLVGDRAQARHTGEDIRRQSDAPEPPRPAADTRPAPGATASVATPAPAQRVAQAPVATPPAAAPRPVAPPPPPPSPAQASAPALPPPPAIAPGPAPGAAPAVPDDTVIVSSSGVQAPGRAAPTAPAAPAARLPMPERAGVEPPAPRGALIKLATIYFVHGSARLSDGEREILQDVATIQRQRGGSVRIVGHASSRTASMDPAEHDRVNLDMSAQRAEVIADALTRHGVSSDQIVTVARADSEPVFFEVMPSGEAGNRRAEIYLEAAGGR